MSNIISLSDFRQPSYIERMKNELDEADYLDILEASYNIQRYNELDEDLKILCDGLISIRM